MYQLRYREELPPAVVKELDDLVASYNQLLSKVINEDGSINWPAALGIPQPKADEIYNPPDSPLLAQFLEAVQAQGQRWKYGPWTFEDINGLKPNAAVRTVGLASSSDPTIWNDFTAEGVQDCIVLSLNPDHNATITGIQSSPYVGPMRRVLVVTNDTTTSGKLITLAHNSSSSAAQNRFFFEDGQDIVLSVGQSCWLLYSPSGGHWVPVVTANESGGLVGTTQLNNAIAGVSSDIKVTSVRIDHSAILTLSSAPVTVVPANGGLIEILSAYCFFSRTVAYGSNPSGSLRYSGDNTDITVNSIFLQTSSLPGTRVFRLPINTSAQIWDPYTNANNQSVVFKASADNSLGNSANFLDVFVVYRTISLNP